MILKEIALLSAEVFEKYKSIIPVINNEWWLRTPYPGRDTCVCVIDDRGNPNYNNCCVNRIGVRPALKLDLASDNPMFWYKSEMFVGTKIRYGKYEWTILDIHNGELFALCDKAITTHRFDRASNDWEASELKTWLETWGLGLITT